MEKFSWKGHGAMLLANTSWGLMSPLAKVVMAGGVVTPFVLTDLRIFGAMVLFWAVSLFQKPEHVPPRDMLPVLGDVEHVSKPTIAAVNGLALAGGWLFAQMCDLVVASRAARFGITEAKVGRGFPWAAPLIHMIPQKVMAEILMTGVPLSAQRAYEIGFVNRLAEPGQTLEEAMKLAREIAANAPLTVAAAKHLIALATDMGRSAALTAAQHAFDRVYRSEDAQEGPRAFGEKRKPVWKNR